MTERKRALVVGGSSGLGLAVAKSLSARGEAVVVTSRDIVRAKAAAREIGGDAMGLASLPISGKSIISSLASAADGGFSSNAARRSNGGLSRLAQSERPSVG